MTQKAKSSNPIYDKTDSCIRLIFSSNSLLAIQLPGEPPRTSEGGKLIYQIDLDSLYDTLDPNRYEFGNDDEDMLENLLAKVNALVMSNGVPIEIETDYPGFKRYSTGTTLIQWVKAVWVAHKISRQQGKQGYKSFLQVLGAIES